MRDLIFAERPELEGKIYIAYCPERVLDVYKRQVYDLKAMPTLYLLDAEKRVILKDASFEQVEERLS